MKAKLFYIILILSSISCQTSNEWNNRSYRTKFKQDVVKNFESPVSHKEYGMDTTLYQKLLENGIHEDCAKVQSYTQCVVKMERQLPNRCHKQELSFTNCSAEIINDTLYLQFRTQMNRLNKMVKIAYINGEQMVHLYHGTHREALVVDQFGQEKTIACPQSTVQKATLKLQKEQYGQGEIIIGEINISSYLPRRGRKYKISEEINGYFRTIVTNPTHQCEPVDLADL